MFIFYFIFITITISIVLLISFLFKKKYDKINYHENLELEILNFIDSILKRKHPKLKELYFLYGLKKEGKIKKILLLEEDNMFAWIQAYINLNEIIEFNLNEELNKNSLIITQNKRKETFKSSIKIEEIEINNIYEKYKNIPPNIILKEITFLLSNKPLILKIKKLIK